MKVRLLLMLCVLTACGPNGGGGGNASFTLKQSLLSLTSARGVLVAPKQGSSTGALQSSNADSTSGPTQTLYTLNSDGSLTETTVVENEDGSTNSTDAQLSALAVYDTPAYVVVAYQGLRLEDGRQCTHVLAKKSDGALFCLPSGSGGGGDTAKAEDILRGGGSYFSPLQSNETGTLLWHNGPSLARIDLTDPAAPGSSNPVDSSLTNNRHFDALRVNARGDVLLMFSFDNKQTRIQRANGGFQNLSTEPTTCLAKGFAQNPNDFYVFENKQAVKYVDGTPYTKVTIGALPDSGMINVYFNCAEGLVQTSNALLAVAGNTLVKVTDAAVQNFQVPTLTKVTQIAGSTSAVMLLGQDTAGNSGIVKFDLATSAFTTLLAPGEYVISKMVVAQNGETTFQGQRASDGANILGNIAAGSTQVDVVSTGFPKVVALVRLN